MKGIPTVLWTCDGCGVTAQLAVGEQPTNWIGLSIHPKPEHAEMVGARRHLCATCAEKNFPGIAEASR